MKQNSVDSSVLSSDKNGLSVDYNGLSGGKTQPESEKKVTRKLMECF